MTRITSAGITACSFRSEIGNVCAPIRLTTTGSPSMRRTRPLWRWPSRDLFKQSFQESNCWTSDNLNHHFHLKKAKIGDFAELVRMVRNLAHPARYRKDHSG